MRLLGALSTDIRFQIKQGIYSVYVVITIFYIIIINVLSDSLKSIIVPLIVFSDPSVAGFFFIGGIVMLEKIQGIYTYLKVTPLRLSEYLFSKLMSYALLSEITGIAIVALVYKGPVNWLFLFIGILLTSIFFTQLGLLAVINCKSMNQYFIRMIPFILIGIIPCVGLIPLEYSKIFFVFPSFTAVKIVYSAFNGYDTSTIAFCIIYTLLMDILLFYCVYKAFSIDNNK